MVVLGVGVCSGGVEGEPVSWPAAGGRVGWRWVLDARLPAAGGFRRVGSESMAWERVRAAAEAWLLAVAGVEAGGAA